MRRRLNFARMQRLEQQLKRFLEEADEVYPGYSATLTGQDDKTETIRNLWTGFTHLSCWINYRVAHGRDPDEALPDAR